MEHTSFCVICYETLLKSNEIQLDCNHSFCKKCILKYIELNIDNYDIKLKNKTFINDYIYELYNILKCPLCRNNINILQLKDSEFVINSIIGNKDDLYKKELMYYSRQPEYNEKYINNIILHSGKLKIKLQDILDMMINSFDLNVVKNYTLQLHKVSVEYTENEENTECLKNIILSLFTNYYYSLHCYINTTEFINFLNSFESNYVVNNSYYNILEEIIEIIKKDYTNYNLISLLSTFIFKYLKSENLFSYKFMKDFLILLKFYNGYSFKLNKECNDSIKNILKSIYKNKVLFLQQNSEEQYYILSIFLDINPEYLDYNFIKELISCSKINDAHLNELCLLCLEKNEHELYRMFFSKIKFLTCFDDILKLENNNDLIQYLNISKVLKKIDVIQARIIFQLIFEKHLEYNIEYINYITLIIEFLSYFEGKNDNLEFLNLDTLIFLKENNPKFKKLINDLCNTVIHIYSKKFFSNYILNKNSLIYDLIINNSQLSIEYIICNKDINFNQYYHKYTSNKISLFKKQKIIHLLCLSANTLEYLMYMQRKKELVYSLYHNSINTKNYEGNFPLHILLKNKNNFTILHEFIKLFNYTIDYTSKDILGMSLCDYINKISLYS